MAGSGSTIRMFSGTADLSKNLTSKNIVTFSQSLDKILDGGVSLGEVIEFYGEKGIGKTAMCMQLCINVQIPEILEGLNSKAVYINTEGTFVKQRFDEMANSCIEHCKRCVGPEPCPITLDTLYDGVEIFSCRVGIQFDKIIQNLRKYFVENSNVKLLVIDSITFIHYESDDFLTRQKELYIMSQELNALAYKFNIAIVVVNNMTTHLIRNSEGEIIKSEEIASLGESWTYLPNKRVHLFKDGNQRVAKVVKPIREENSIASFRVISAGIRD